MTVEILVWGGASLPPVAAGTLVLRDRASCLARFDQVKRAAESDEDMRVLVRDDLRPIFDVLLKRPGVRIRDLRPRAELTRLWGRSLPVMLDDAAILALELASTALPADADPAGFVLARAFDDTSGLFAKPRLTTADERVLVSHILRSTIPDNARPAVEGLLRSRLRAWNDTGSDVAGALAADLSRAAWLATFALLEAYPPMVREGVVEEMQAHLGPRPAGLPLIEIHLAPGDLPVGLRLPIEAALRPHLHALPMARYLAMVSGYLPVELAVLVERAGSEGNVVDLDAIVTRFSALGSDTVMKAMIEIRTAHRASLALAAVGAPRAAFVDFSEAAEFFITDYMPAKQAFGGRLEVRERLIAWNEAYGAWLVENYPRLLVSRGSRDCPFAADRLHALIRELLAIGKLPIVLVVDGLGYEAYERLAAAADRGGLHRLDTAVCLAPLPTITEVGMTSLVAGSSIAAVAQEAPDRARWRRARESWFTRSFPGTRFGRAGNRPQVLDALSTPAPLYLLHSLVVDRLIHDPDLGGDLLARWLAGYFDDIWAAIGDAAELGHLAERLADITIVVATDHGYTDLLRPEPIGIPAVLSYLSEPIEAQATHRRAIELRLPVGPEGRQLRDRLAADWYVLEGERFGLPDQPSWLIPRQQRTTSAPPARTHGGPSLEETMVPLASFALNRPSSAELRLAVHGRLVVGTTTTVTLTVTNLSIWPVRRLRFRATDIALDTSLERVDPTSSAHAQVTVSPNASGSHDIAVRVSALGEPSRDLIMPVYVEPSEAERLLGDDRLSDFFGPEGL